MVLEREECRREVVQSYDNFKEQGNFGKTLLCDALSRTLLKWVLSKWKKVTVPKSAQKTLKKTLKVSKRKRNTVENDNEELVDSSVSKRRKKDEDNFQNQSPILPLLWNCHICDKVKLCCSCDICKKLFCFDSKNGIEQCGYFNSEANSCHCQEDKPEREKLKNIFFRTFLLNSMQVYSLYLC